MAKQSNLGEAQVAIRASMDQLDKDLSSAKSKIGGALKTIGGIGAAGLGAVATAGVGVVGAVAGIGVALGNMAQQAAPVVDIKNSFEALASASGETGDQILSDMQKASSGTVAARDLMLTYNKATQLVGSEFANNMTPAIASMGKVAAATGADANYLLDSYTTGIGRLSPMILDNLGIQVDLNKAYEDWAEVNGKAVAEMSKAEKQAALQIQVNEKLAENTADLPEVTESATAKFAQLQAQMQDFKDEIGAAFMPVMLTLMDTIMELADSVLPIVIPFVDLFSQGITSIFEALSPLLPLITEFASRMEFVMEQLADGNISTAMGAFQLAIKNLVGGLVEHLPAIMEFGIDLILKIIEGILSALPVLVSAGLTIVFSLAEKLISMLPTILEVGIDILLAVVDGLAQALPELIPMAINMIITLVMSLLEQLPEIIDTGIELLFALIDGILNALPDLIQAVPEIIIAIVDTIVEKLPDILEAGGEILTELVVGIIENLPELIAAVPEIITAIVEGLAELAPQLLEAGKNIIEGLWAGIQDAWAGFKRNIMNLFPDLPGWVQDLLGISSPSKVFAEIGKDLNRGLALGIEQTIELPEKELNYNFKEIELPSISGGDFSPNMDRGAVSKVENHYHLEANYKHQDEMTITDQLRVLNLLGGTA